MAEYILTLNKEDVYNEVAKTTAYAGAKSTDITLYDKLSTIDEDEEMLDRFWEESKTAASSILKKVYSKEEEKDGVYKLTLDLSGSFNTNFLPGMNKSLFSFFVTDIISKWYAFINKEDATRYATEATFNIEDVKRKAFYKIKPERPVYI